MSSQDLAASASDEFALTGLALAVARSLCELMPEADATEIQVFESEPPFLAKGYTPVWGEWRVLRARRREGVLELTVARELLGEVRVARAGRPS